MRMQTNSCKGMITVVPLDTHSLLNGHDTIDTFIADYHSCIIQSVHFIMLWQYIILLAWRTTSAHMESACAVKCSGICTLPLIIGVKTEDHLHIINCIHMTGITDMKSSVLTQ